MKTKAIQNRLFGEIVIGLIGIFLLFVIKGCNGCDKDNPVSPRSIGETENVISALSQLNISLSHPVSPVKISQYYGQNRKDYNNTCKRNGVNYYHTGIDYSNAGSLDIRAAADGIVISIPSEGGSCLNHGLGNTIIIKHSTSKGSLYTLYGHLANIFAKQGQQVKRDDKIAKMGNTCAESVHLHFELKSKAVLENPTGAPCGTSTCSKGTGNKCWGYTQGYPDNYGYYDPIKYIKPLLLKALIREKDT